MHLLTLPRSIGHLQNSCMSAVCISINNLHNMVKPSNALWLEVVSCCHSSRDWPALNLSSQYLWKRCSSLIMVTVPQYLCCPTPHWKSVRTHFSQCFSEIEGSVVFAGVGLLDLIIDQDQLSRGFVTFSSLSTLLFCSFVDRQSTLRCHFFFLEQFPEKSNGSAPFRLFNLPILPKLRPLVTGQLGVLKAK